MIEKLKLVLLPSLDRQRQVQCTGVDRKRVSVSACFDTVDRRDDVGYRVISAVQAASEGAGGTFADHFNVDQRTASVPGRRQSQRAEGGRFSGNTGAVRNQVQRGGDLVNRRARTEVERFRSIRSVQLEDQVVLQRFATGDKCVKRGRTSLHSRTRRR